MGMRRRAVPCGGGTPERGARFSTACSAALVGFTLHRLPPRPLSACAAVVLGPRNAAAAPRRPRIGFADGGFQLHRRIVKSQQQQA
ncbi:hypothetical protein U9M48_014377 [Paspalum notatum var. saurae]|uniref:Uncharacterized protein n=1 Tax=Paspalum notatum var. saurae TaxID=547442 RepID=A0AAQ3T1G1_PASNO